MKLVIAAVPSPEAFQEIKEKFSFYELLQFLEDDFFGDSTEREKKAHWLITVGARCSFCDAYNRCKFPLTQEVL